MSKEFLSALWGLLQNYPKESMILAVCCGLLLLAVFLFGKATEDFWIDAHYNCSIKK